MIEDQLPDFERPDNGKLETGQEAYSKGKQLNDIEEKEYREGEALRTMIETSEGWRLVKEMLEDLAYHSWVDPRGTKAKDEWVWAEMNAFHAANNAKELLVRIQEKIDRADYLGKVRAGEIVVKQMKI